MEEFINCTPKMDAKKIDILPWNNPSNILTYQDYLAALYYNNIVMKPLVVFTGVLTNACNCWVFKRQGLGDRVNLCLFALALVDIVYLLWSMGFTVTYWIRLLEPILGEELYRKTHSYAMGVCSGFRETSACISVVIAVERCVCVVFPLRANSLMTTRTMARLLVAIVISMQLAFVATPIKRFVYPVYDNSTGGIRWGVDRAAAWQNSETLLLYDTIDDTIMLIIFPFVTFLLVSGATAITVVKVKVAVSWRMRTSSARSSAKVQQVALTKMLVAASCAFIVCKVPVIILTLATIADRSFSAFGSQSNLFRVSEIVAHYFPYAHCTVSFFVYHSLSSRFRSEVARLCGCSRMTSRHSKEMTTASVGSVAADGNKSATFSPR